MKAVAKASEAKAAATKKAGADMAKAAEKSEAKQGEVKALEKTVSEAKDALSKKEDEAKKGGKPAPNQTLNIPPKEETAQKPPAEDKKAADKPAAPLTNEEYAYRSGSTWSTQVGCPGNRLL